MNFSKTKSEKSQHQLVKKYFDLIAVDYAKRYQKAGSYHAYFFNERLHEATNGIDFNGVAILDIGAGTGALYDFLQGNYKHWQYTAADISQEMLRHSSIPKVDQVIGQISDLQFTPKSFDFIFLLGVTTYIPRDTLKAQIACLHTWLKDNGKIIVSFTHSSSLDHHLRQILKPFSLLAKGKNAVIQQDFKATSYTKSEVLALVQANYDLESTTWLNHTFTPFNQLFSRPSIRLARVLKCWLPDNYLPFFSADLLTILSAK